MAPVVHFPPAPTGVELLPTFGTAVAAASPTSAASAKASVTQRDAVDAEDLIHKLQAVTLMEKKNAEEGRGLLVKTWRDKAQTEKHGRDFRGIISYDCMRWRVGQAALSPACNTVSLECGL